MKISILLRNEEAKADLEKDLFRNGIEYQLTMGYVVFEVTKISSNCLQLTLGTNKKVNVYIRTEDIKYYETI